MVNLESFSAKDLRMVKLVLQIMEETGLSIDDFPVAPVPPSKPQEPTPEPAKSPLLPGGGAERIEALRCPCGGSFIIEGLCGKQIAKLGCVRLAVCDSCSKEIKIR